MEKNCLRQKQGELLKLRTSYSHSVKRHYSSFALISLAFVFLPSISSCTTDWNVLLHIRSRPIPLFVFSGEDQYSEQILFSIHLLVLEWIRTILTNHPLHPRLTNQLWTILDHLINRQIGIIRNHLKNHFLVSMNLSDVMKVGHYLFENGNRHFSLFSQSNFRWKITKIERLWNCFHMRWLWFDDCTTR